MVAYRLRFFGLSRAPLITFPTRTFAASSKVKAGLALPSASLRASRLWSAPPSAEKFVSGILGARATRGRLSVPVATARVSALLRSKLRHGAYRGRQLLSA